MFYIRNWGRPCGVEPKVFSSKEEAEVPLDDENLLGGPSIEEFATREEAERALQERE